MPPANVHYVVLDVRPLQRARKEPFQVIMETVNRLSDGEGLLLLNTFEPVPLYRVLGRLGFDHEAEEREDGTWYVWFHRQAPAGPEG